MDNFWQTVSGDILCDICFVVRMAMSKRILFTKQTLVFGRETC